MTIRQVLKELANRGWTVITRDRRTAKMQGPNGYIGVFEPRVLLEELIREQGK